MAHQRPADCPLKTSAIAPGRLVTKLGNPRALGVITTGLTQPSSSLPGYNRGLALEVRWISGRTNLEAIEDLSNYNWYLAELERDLVELAARRAQAAARLGIEILPDIG
jgi:hypothetical protein